MNGIRNDVDISNKYLSARTNCANELRKPPLIRNWVFYEFQLMKAQHPNSTQVLLKPKLKTKTWPLSLGASLPLRLLLSYTSSKPTLENGRCYPSVSVPVHQFDRIVKMAMPSRSDYVHNNNFRGLCSLIVHPTGRSPIHSQFHTHFTVWINKHLQNSFLSSHYAGNNSQLKMVVHERGINSFQWGHAMNHMQGKTRRHSTLRIIIFSFCSSLIR